MSTSKHIDIICCIAAVLAVVTCALLACSDRLGIQTAESTMGYETRLFDTASVHNVDIVMDDWDDFIANCENEEYSPCSVVIDGEAFSGVGIRAKGNTSLSSVSSMDSDRYSFKIEFDQYDNSKTYYGLDKLSLNNLIQDTTMMKDYLVYQLMGSFGAAAPLCSFVYITVNGEDWGLYLAVEGVEDAFLQRNYGSNSGELYKPDSMSMGGGRGNGRDFNMEDLDFSFDASGETAFDPSDMEMPDFSREKGESFGGMPDMGIFSGMGSSDVKLQYSSDDPVDYSSIFGQAKTVITDADQTRLIAALKSLSEGDTAAVDVDAVLRYFVVHNFAVNGDSYTGSMIHNYYLYEEDGVLSMIPWDYNLAFGTFQGGNGPGAVNDPIDTPLSVTGSGDRPMADWIFSSEEYLSLYHEYFEEFLATTDIVALIDETAPLIAPYVAKDPTAFYSAEDFAQGVATLREFCALREESILAQLEGTIPSTDAGQSADSSALVDASHLTLSNMGSMGGGMGGKFPSDFGAQMPDFGSGEMPSMPGGESGRMPEMNGQFPSDFGGQMPNFGSGEMPSMPGGDGQMPEMNGQFPSDFGAQMPGFGNGENSSRPTPGGQSFPGSSAEGGVSFLPLLLVSFLVLSAGLIIAKRYKR